MHRLRLRLLALLGTFVLLGLAACGGSDETPGGDSSPSSTSTGGTTPPDDGAGVTVRLGLFPNVTHAPAILANENGLFAEKLQKATLEVKTFNAGPEAVEALFSGAIDASFVGPNPAINAFAKSNGEAIRIVAGSTSGGAFLVVKPTISSAADLKGKTLASPQLGQTQDVALRNWLSTQGLKTDASGGGDVSIKPQANADSLTQFQSGQIDGAWVPEPWATRLVTEGGGKVLVDEKTLWPDGKYVTTLLMVSTTFLNEHPAQVKALIEGEQAAIDLIASSPADAEAAVNTGIAKVTGKPLAESLIHASFANLTFTLDPLAATLKTSAEHAKALGLLEAVDLEGIFDLRILNEVLAASDKPPVDA